MSQKHKKSSKTTPSHEGKVDIVKQATIDAINRSCMTKEGKKKAIAFMLCEPKDLPRFIDIPNVPNNLRKKYNEDDYDDEGNLI